MRVGLGVLVAVALVAAGCGGVPPSASVEPVPSQAATTQPAPQASNAAWVTTGDGVSLTVEVDHLTLAPGDDVTFTATLTNHRSEPVKYQVAPCGDVAQVAVVLGVPTEPEGRGWPGMAGEFKRYALTKGYAAGGGLATDPMRTDVWRHPCADAGAFERELPPGESVTSTVPWQAELVDGIGVPPGTVPFEVRAGYDRLDAPQANADGSTGLQFMQFKELRLSGELMIQGQAPQVVSAGEAVDAVLNDLHFVHWLEAQPMTTWSNANLMLRSHPAAEGIVPAGPTWAVELFREVGVPRHWAIAHVNAIDGELIRIDYCDIPCDR